MSREPHAVSSCIDASMQASLARAVAVLSAGGLVCMPTETTYGLAADIRNRIALEALVALKGRDPDAPFGLIAADVAQARLLARIWPPRAERLANAHWPGPLTLVVPAASGLPPEIVGPGGGVGVRVSNHPIPLALARAMGSPITATSANPSGMPAALDIDQARAYFGDLVAYIDGGAAPAQAGSTVVAIVPDGQEGRMSVLRVGLIDVSSEAAGDVVRSTPKSP